MQSKSCFIEKSKYNNSCPRELRSKTYLRIDCQLDFWNKASFLAMEKLNAREIKQSNGERKRVTVERGKIQIVSTVAESALKSRKSSTEAQAELSNSGTIISSRELKERLEPDDKGNYLACKKNFLCNKNV